MKGERDMLSLIFWQLPHILRRNLWRILCLLNALQSYLASNFVNRYGIQKWSKE